MISVRSEVQVLPGPPGSEVGIQRTEYGSFPISVLCIPSSDGAIAQLGERVLCKHEVVGSIPSGSTNRSAEDGERRTDRRSRRRVSGSTASPIHRVSPCASRGAFTENDVSGAVYPSSVFRSLLSVIVKRKHIRSVPEYGRRSTGDGCLSVFRSPSSVLRSEPLSRGPRLTARLPDVFEAKLVFSTEGRCRALFGFYRGAHSNAIARSMLGARSLVMRTIKCHKGIWWMPWR